MTPKITVAGKRVALSFGAAPAPPPPVSSLIEKGLPLEIPALAPIGGQSGNGWAGHYSVDIRGKSDEAIVAEVERIKIHHAKKSARLEEFVGVVGTAVAVNGRSYFLADIGISERGTDVELRVAVVEGGRRTGITRVYATVDDVPTIAQIITLVSGEHLAREQAAADEEAANLRLAALLSL